MKNILFIVLFFVFNLNNLYSQWNVINVGTSNPLYSVDYFSLNDIWIGSYSSIVKTNTGGASWSTISAVTGNWYDLALTNSTNAIGTGLFIGGNDELILNTTNGGVNWNYASINSSIGYPPRYMNTTDVSSNFAIAVGRNGRIGRSIDYGSTWSFVPSGTTNFICDVKFASIDTIFAVGDNCILRSVDAGITWSVTSITGSFKTVSCDHDNIYVGCYNSASVLKSIDYGNSYMTINLPFTSLGILYAIDKDTLAIAGNDGIYVSRSGGQYWEKYILPPNYHNINMFDFYNKERGIGVGNAGYVIKTDNLSSCPKIPVSVFSISGVHCLGDSLILSNFTVPGCSYLWKINGIDFSTSYNTGIVLTNSGSQIISLISTNVYGSDTLNVTFNVLGHNVINPFSITTSTDTICNGNSVTFTIPVSQSGVSYQLRRNYTNVGSIQYGTGSTLTFNSGATNGTNVFSIKATRSNSCFIDSVLNYKTIYSLTAPSSTIFYVSRDTVCYNDTASLIIPNSLIGYKYTWYNVTLAITGTNFVYGNGSTISIPLSALTASELFAPKAINISKGCSSIFSPAKSIIADRTAIYFTFNTYNPEVGENVNIINNSINITSSFQWDFGIGANPQYSNLVNPTNVIYSSSGQKPVKLICITHFGCIDSLIRNINVINPFVENTCNYIETASLYDNSGVFVAIKYDQDENIISWFNGGSINKQITYSNHGDSIITNILPDYNYDNSYILSKCNPKGVPMWSTKLLTGEWSIKFGDIETDSTGNIYCSYFQYSTDTVQIFNSDNSFIKIKPSGSVIILKYNKNGILQWYNTYNAYYTLNKISMKLDKEDNLYICNDGQLNYKLNKYNQSGQLCWSVNGNYTDVEIDSHDFIWTLSNISNNIQVNKFDSLGTLLYTSPPITNLSASIFSLYMKLDEIDNIYIAGQFRNKLIYNNDTINNGNVDNVFLCKMRPNGQQCWFKHFKSNNSSYMKGIDIKNNQIVLLATKIVTIGYVDTVKVQNLAPIVFTYPGHYLYYTDSLGGSESLLKLYETSYTNLGSLSYDNELISFSKNSDNLLVGFEFNTDFSYLGTTIMPYSSLNIFNSYFIGKGTLNCFLPNFPSLNSPFSNFSVSSSYICAGQSITFTDISSNSPNTWNWDFSGGSPSISFLQNPTVTFNASGTYVVSLYASNSFGMGTIYIDTIYVTAQPNISISLSGNTITATSVANSYQWIDCNNNLPIIGATNQSYTATSNGNYAVILTQGLCSDTSACIQLTIVGITSTQTEYISIYPNPVSNELIIEAKGIKNNKNFEIINSIGQVVFTGTLLSNTVIKTTNFATGVYLIKLDNGKTFEFKKIIKE